MYDLEREIQEITDEKIFFAIHEAYGHCLAEHILTDKELSNKLYDMPKPKSYDDIVMATRFYSKESALNFIQSGMLREIDKVKQWRAKLMYPFLELSVTFKEPVGEGIIKNADHKKKVPVHGLRIILIVGDKMGRAFYIKTAYPIRVFEDIDNIYDAIDEWQEKKKEQEKRR